MNSTILTKATFIFKDNWCSYFVGFFLIFGYFLSIHSLQTVTSDVVKGRVDELKVNALSGPSKDEISADSTVDA